MNTWIRTTLLCLCYGLNVTANGQTATPTNASPSGSNAATLAATGAPPAVVTPSLAPGIPAGGGSSLSVGPQVFAVISDPNATILKYQEFLQRETVEHRNFIEGFYRLMGCGFIFFVSVAGYFGIKSWKDLKKTVVETAQQRTDEGIQNAIGDALDRRMRWLEATHRASNMKIYRELKSVFKQQVTGHLPAVSNRDALRDKKILWVDDDLPGIACHVAVFELFNIRVKVSQSTQEAVEEIGKDGYHLVISNMNRDPDSTAGILLAKKIRQTSAVPILIFTKPVHVTNHGEMAKVAGVDALISNPDELIGQVEILLAKRDTTDNHT